MKKNKYYVKVGSGEILSDPTLSEWEYEIKATDDEINQLKVLFDRVDLASDHSFWRSLTPAVPYHLDEENDQYDESLSEVYQTLYRLGDENVKNHIESMDILKST